MLTESENSRRLADPRLDDVMDLCLSCKACKSECPSNVDVAKMKAEFQQAWFDRHGIPLRSRVVANIDQIMRWSAKIAPLYNRVAGSPVLAGLINRLLGFHPKRSLPKVQRHSLFAWMAARGAGHPTGDNRGSVILFCDEFTNWQDVPVGIAAVELLEGLGYSVRVVPHVASGRAAISAGLLRKARHLAETNVQVLSRSLESLAGPVIGLEPSALLTLRDEYPELVRPEWRQASRELAERTWLIDEFVSAEISSGRIHAASFTDRRQDVCLHGHCHQRALSSLKPTIRMLQLPARYRVRLIPSGCCGMAGSFGFEREHYPLSMAIGELVLFPAIRQTPPETLIAAPGTSCRHQIRDGTGRIAWHPVQILRQALQPEENRQ